MKGVVLALLVAVALAQYEAEDYATHIEEPEHWYNSEHALDVAHEHKTAKEAHLKRIIAEEKHYVLHHKAIEKKKKKKKNYKIDPKSLIDAKMFHSSEGVRFDDFDDEEVKTMSMEEPESHYASEHSLDDRVKWSLERSKATREIVRLEREILLEKGHKLEHAHGHVKFVKKGKANDDKFIHTTEVVKVVKTKRSAAATVTVSALMLVAAVLAVMF